MEIDKIEVYTYIKSMIGIEIHDGTRFFDEVGIDGLDAEQMMIQIAEKYLVDLSNYDPTKYHYTEAEITNFILPIWQTICNRRQDHLSFTALHLYNVIKAGNWFPPPPENKQ